MSWIQFSALTEGALFEIVMGHARDACVMREAQALGVSFVGEAGAPSRAQFA
jgi:hypothetical protein